MLLQDTLDIAAHPLLLPGSEGLPLTHPTEDVAMAFHFLQHQPSVRPFSALKVRLFVLNRIRTQLPADPLDRLFSTPVARSLFFQSQSGSRNIGKPCQTMLVQCIA